MSYPITIGVGNFTQGSTYALWIDADGICNDLTGTPDEFFTTPQINIDLSDYGYEVPNLWCYKVCEIDEETGSYTCCCTSTEDPPIDPIKEVRFAQECCDTIVYPVEFQYYPTFDITENVVFCSNGRCYIVGDITTQDAAVTTAVVNNYDNTNGDGCANANCGDCAYKLIECGTSGSSGTSGSAAGYFYFTDNSPFENGFETGENGTYIYYNETCYWMDGPLPVEGQFQLDAENISEAQSECAVCVDATAYRIKPCGVDTTFNVYLSIDGQLSTDDLTGYGLSIPAGGAPNGYYDGCYIIQETLTTLGSTTFDITTQQLQAPPGSDAVNTCTSLIQSEFCEEYVYPLYLCDDPSINLGYFQFVQNNGVQFVAIETGDTWISDGSINLTNWGDCLGIGVPELKSVVPSSLELEYQQSQHIPQDIYGSCDEAEACNQGGIGMRVRYCGSDELEDFVFTEAVEIGQIVMFQNYASAQRCGTIESFAPFPIIGAPSITTIVNIAPVGTTCQEANDGFGFTACGPIYKVLRCSNDSLLGYIEIVNGPSQPISEVSTLTLLTESGYIPATDNTVAYQDEDVSIIYSIQFSNITVGGSC